VLAISSTLPPLSSIEDSPVQMIWSQPDKTFFSMQWSQLSCVFKKKERPVKTMYGGHIRVVLDLDQNRLTQGQQDLVMSSCYRQCSRSPPLIVVPAGSSQMCHANACRSGGMELMTLTAAVPTAPLTEGELSERTVKMVGALEDWMVYFAAAIVMTRMGRAIRPPRQRLVRD